MHTTIVVACKLIQLVFNIHWLVRSTAGPWYGVVAALMDAPLRLREKKINASYEHRLGTTLFGAWRHLKAIWRTALGTSTGPSLAVGRPKKREKRSQAPQRPGRTLFVKGCALGVFARYATSEGQRRTEREVIEHRRVPCGDVLQWAMILQLSCMILRAK